MESKFKVGDRVRVVTDMEQPYYMWVEKGDAGVIVEGSPVKGFECVKIDGCANMDYVCVESKYLETDATYNPKTAFLSELKGLLEKYDASIYVDFNQSDEIYTTTIAVGEDSVKYNYTDGIDCDNIIDYDKE